LARDKTNETEVNLPPNSVYKFTVRHGTDKHRSFIVRKLYNDSRQ